MVSLCGNETFWDWNRTWSGKWPEFSSCFISLVLTCTPCLALWSVALVYLPWLARQTAAARSTDDCLFWAKQVSGCMLLVLNVVNIFISWNNMRAETLAAAGISLAQLLAACTKTVTMVLVMLVVILERKLDMMSVVLYLFWLVAVVLSIVPFYTYIFNKAVEESLVQPAVFYVTFALELLQLALHSLSSRTTSQTQGENAETVSSFPAWLTYCWLSRLMSRGYKGDLQEADVSGLRPRDRMINAGEALHQNLVFRLQARQECRADSMVWTTPVTAAPQNQQNSDLCEKTPLLSVEWNRQKSSEELPCKGRPGLAANLEGGPVHGLAVPIPGRALNSQVALGRTLAKAFCWSAVVSNVCKLPHDLLMLCNPLLLREVIRMCEDVTVPGWHVYAIDAILCVSLLLQALFFHLTFHLTMTLGLRVKAAVTAAIFKKVLRLSSKGRENSTEGELINLIAVDTQHVAVFLSFLPYAWSCPIQLGVAIYFLYDVIGFAALVGAALLVVLLPVNVWLMNRLGDTQNTLMEHKDTRLKMVSEILSAIKVVKVYAWERILGSRVSSAREAELRVLQKVALLDASQTVLWALTPFLMALLIFVTHVFTAQSPGLDPEEVFVTLSYLNMMRAAVTVAPMVITDVMKATVSLKRLEHFLNQEELDPNSVITDPTQEAAVVIEEATCAWGRFDEPCLHGLSLEIKEGALVAVVGETGSGKSSLLAALLGELHVRRGSVTVKCAVSYVPQQAWLQQSSVRDNIVGLGQPLDPVRFHTTVAACALRSDLATMPAGNRTQIGERGLTLSGGQRQRINLARAVYESRDLYIMDDPVSAVDSRVGGRIYRNIIGPKGLLRDATRIVATSTYFWLSEADLIVVMSEGTIVEMGDYQQLLSQAVHFKRLLSPLRLATRYESSNRHESGCRVNAEGSISKELQPITLNIVVIESPQEECPDAADLCYKENHHGLAITNDTKPGQDNQISQEAHQNHLLELAALKEVSESAISQRPRPRSPMPSCLLASKFKEFAAQEKLSVEEPEAAASTDCQREILFPVLTDLMQEESRPMDTLVEHSEEGLLTDSFSSKSRDRLLDPAGQTSQSTAWGPSELLTSMSCEPIARGRQRHCLIDDEHVHVGKVKWKVYITIARSLGWIFFLVILSCYVFYHVISVVANYWLSYWTDVFQARNVTEERDGYTNSQFYLTVYGGLGAGQCLVISLYAWLLAVRRVHAARSMHSTLIQNVLRSPLDFFLRNPTARVLNRLSRDLEVFDRDLWWTVEVVLDSLCYVISTCVIVCLLSPFFALAMLPVAAAYCFIQRYYIGTSRQLRRLESKTCSPVYSHLSHMLTGSVIIRAAGARATELAYERAADLVNSNFKFTFAYNTAGRWLGVRVAAIGVLIVGVVTTLAVTLRAEHTAGVIGLTIVYALDITENLNWLVRMSCDLETNAVAVERILEYSCLTPERERCPILVLPQSWPNLGRIEFCHLSARYSPESPPVLKNINCVIQPAEKVAVVGRTGAGKTSMWGVLLGLVPSIDGAVLIDGVDIRSVRLQELRSRVAVLPQEPVLFSGSVRFNLDPAGQASDEALWEVLRLCQLDGHVSSLPGSLDYQCQPQGAGFSDGQRQLLCLARVLLRDCRVVILDEPTSSLDMETDDVIWRTIETACAARTVLIISHRLRAVRLCNRVMVFEGGRVVEMDSPVKLLADPFSRFSKLAASYTLT